MGGHGAGAKKAAGGKGGGGIATGGTAGPGGLGMGTGGLGQSFAGVVYAGLNWSNAKKAAQATSKAKGGAYLSIERKTSAYVVTSSMPKISSGKEIVTVYKGGKRSADITVQSTANISYVPSLGK